MSTNHKPHPDEVEHLLRNAELRDELEPYFDESIRNVNVEELPTPVENEFLASMLAWERAPILPISQWFEPELTLPHPGSARRGRLARSAVGDDSQVVRAADRARLHRSSFRSRVVLPDLSRHSSLLGEEDRLGGELSALGLRGRGRRRRRRGCATTPRRRSVARWAEDFDEPLPDAEEPPYRVSCRVGRCSRCPVGPGKGTFYFIGGVLRGLPRGRSVDCRSNRCAVRWSIAVAQRRAACQAPLQRRQFHFVLRLVHHCHPVARRRHRTIVEKSRPFASRSPRET